jgi:hypothetical protein
VQLFNRIQLSNDRIMVANSTAMQQILRATQEETRMSRTMAIRAHELTEEMKKDSLSMKTIAVLTMFFLPGTSFAVSLLPTTNRGFCIFLATLRGCEGAFGHAVLRYESVARRYVALLGLGGAYCAVDGACVCVLLVL